MMIMVISLRELMEVSFYDLELTVGLCLFTERLVAVHLFWQTVN